MGKQKVTEDMIQNIIKLYTVDKMSAKEIAEQNNISSSTIFRYLHNYNIPININCHIDNLSEQIIELYCSGLSKQKVADKLCISIDSINRILHENNVHIRNNTEYRDYSIDCTYFDEINTANKAYVLGFLYADGNVSKRKNNIQLSLQENDREVLEKIRKDMKYSAELEYRDFVQYNEKTGLKTRNQYALIIHCKQLHDSLIKLGVVPRKTHIIKYPDFLSEEMHRHFIRGVLDGDGCIHKPYGDYDKHKNVDINGTYDFCCGLAKIVNDTIGVHCSIIKTAKNRTTYRAAISGGNNVCKFLDWIYENADIYLERKYQLYKEYYCKKVS